MHDLLDDYAHANALRDVSPRLKLSVGLASILLSVSSPTPAAPLFVALSLSLATVLLAKIPARIYLQLLLLPFSFAGLSAAVVAFMHGSGDVLLSLPILGSAWASGRTAACWRCCSSPAPWAACAPCSFSP